ncbi:hypothetical protein BC832DRAFT_590303 [Gaertneriomyces semiglobifer]|nr:hypothetical protein BC832DRAFT_590303 [Gaertneriomyces semiglobifer]
MLGAGCAPLIHNDAVGVRSRAASLSNGSVSEEDQGGRSREDMRLVPTVGSGSSSHFRSSSSGPSVTRRNLSLRQSKKRWLGAAMSDDESSPDSEITLNDRSSRSSSSPIDTQSRTGIPTLPVAPARDSAEFHRLFHFAPSSDVLVDNFASAWNRDGLLIQGRIWISIGGWYFRGWTGGIICAKWEQVVNVKKRNIVGLIPNSIEFEIAESESVDEEVVNRPGQSETNGGDSRAFYSPAGKYFFASFFNRDSAFDVICKAWNNWLSENVLPPAAKAAMMLPSPAPTPPSASPADTPIDRPSTPVQGLPAITITPTEAHLVCTCSEIGTCHACYLRRKRANSTPASATSTPPPILPAALTLPRTRRALRNLIRPNRGDEGSADFEPSDNSECEESGDAGGGDHIEAVQQSEARVSHIAHERVLPHKTLAQCYPLPFSTMYEALFHVPGFYTQFLESYGVKAISFTPWMSRETTLPPPTVYNTITKSDTAFSPEISKLQAGDHRQLKYTMPLQNPLGPRSAPCDISETIESVSETHICTLGIANMGEVPGAGSFEVHTRICLIQERKDQTKLDVATEIVFVKSSWLRKAIERATPGEQVRFWKAFEKDVWKLCRNVPKSQRQATEDEAEPGSAVEIEEDSSESAYPSLGLERSVTSTTTFSNLLMKAIIVLLAVWVLSLVLGVWGIWRLVRAMERVEQIAFLR